MRKMLLAGCAVLGISANAANQANALVTPERMRKGEGGDDRVLQVWWQPGVVIKLTPAVGQTLLIEMPKGMMFGDTMLSDQNIITPDAFTEIDPATGRQIENPAKEKNDNGCTYNINIKLCVRRERFLLFQPLRELSEQSFPTIFLEKKKIKGKEEEVENVFIFQLTTLEKQENDGEPVSLKPYYSVKVVVGEPPKPAVPVAAVPTAPAVPVAPQASQPPTVAAMPPSLPDASTSDLLAARKAYRPVVTVPARRGPTAQDKRQLEDLQRAPAPPAVVNNKYIIQGDKNLLGR